ncbi:hypothetical protein QTP88_018503 [Uroleucon formosanum]
MMPQKTTNPIKTKPVKPTNTSNLKQNITTSSRIQSASSDVFNSSTEMGETDFTQLKSSKRILSSGTPTDSKKPKPMSVTTNRYSSLNIDDDTAGSTSLHTQVNSEINFQTPEVNNEIKIKLPPPIFICELLDFVSFRKKLISLIGSENFLFKSSTNALKIQTINSDSYRKTIHFLNEGKAQFHTFQPQEDKAFRIVIRNLHPSTSTTKVGIAIEDRLFCTSSSKCSPEVLLTLDAQPLPQPRQACLTEGIMNWAKFRDNLDQNIDLRTSLKSPEDIEIATQKLTNLIQSAAWNSSIKKNPKKHSNPFSITAFTMELVAQKRRARALWQRSRLPSDKNIYNNLSSSLKRNLNQLKNESFNSWVSSISAKDGSLWNATRQCLKQKPKCSPLKKTGWYLVQIR